MTKEQEKKLNDIHMCLLGDKNLGIEGVVKRVDKNEKEITGIKQKVFYVSGAVAAAVVILKLIGSKIWTLFV